MWIMLPFGFLTFVLGLLENVLKENVLVERLSFYCFSVKGGLDEKKSKVMSGGGDNNIFLFTA